MVISFPIDLFDYNPNDNTQTIRYPICFNLYRTKSIYDSESFIKLGFWEEYHSLKAISVNTTPLSKNLLFPKLKEKNILVLSLLFEYSMRNFSSFTKNLLKSEFVNPKTGTSNDVIGKPVPTEKPVGSFMPNHNFDKKESNSTFESSTLNSLIDWCTHFNELFTAKKMERKICLEYYHRMINIRIN